MNSKIKLIDAYIEKCEKCKDYSVAKNLTDTIVSVFKNDIADITDGLDSYNPVHVYENLNGENVRIDYISDVKLLGEKISYYKASLEYEIDKLQKNNVPFVSVNQNTNISIALSLEQTINLIESIPNEKLSPDEKEQLEGKLSKLGTEKEKSKVWDKAQSVLKWIADKGVEVGIAALPYIVEMLKNAK